MTADRVGSSDGVEFGEGDADVYEVKRGVDVYVQTWTDADGKTRKRAVDRFGSLVDEMPEGALVEHEDYVGGSGPRDAEIDAQVAAPVADVEALIAERLNDPQFRAAVERLVKETPS